MDTFSTLLQASLLASMYDVHGLDPVVHPPLFYGNPADVPPRPPVIAAQRVHLPTADADSLPFFSPNGGVLEARSRTAAALQHPPHRPAVRQVSTPLGELRVPAPPPLRAWSYAPQPPRPDTLWSAAAEAPRVAFASGFVTDQASGRLVPANAADAACADEDDLGLSVAATPRSLAATQPLTAAAEVPLDGTQPTVEFRPPSPKYDERSFFISPLQLVMPTQATVEGSATQTRSRLGAQATVHAPATESTVGGPQGGSLWQRRLRPASQITPPSRRTAGACPSGVFSRC